MYYKSNDKRTMKSSELIGNGLLKRLEDNDFDKVYTLMDMSFPDDEHRSYVEQKKLLNNSKYIIYVMPDDENNDIKAFITVYRFEDFAFVEHFAVNPKYRNQGIGSLILKELKKILKCRICLEVELPKTENAKKRISFYERNGFYLNQYPYVQPPFSENKHEIPLWVMTTGHAVEIDEFEQIKKILFKDVYHIYE